MKTKAKLSILLSLSLVSSALFGEEMTEGFSSGEVPEAWAVAKGDWQVQDGVLVGKELASDKHAAVLTIPDSHGDSKISFKFRADGMKMFALSYNHPKGHLFRVKIDSKTVMLIMDKDKKDPASKAETLEKKEFAASSGEWIDVSCEVKGNRAIVKFGDVELSGSHDNLTKGKTGYRFVVAGESVAIDDIAYESAKSDS